jgi:hypothetical protein
VDDFDLNPFRRRLLKHGEPADARVLEVDVPGNQSPGAFLTHKYVLEVQPPGVDPFQAHVKDALSVFWAPKRGDMIRVKFSTKSHKVALDLDGDPRYDSSMQQQPGQWTPGEPGPPSIFGAAPANPDTAQTDGGNPARRLQQLTQLRDAGLLTTDEYELQRRRVIESV